MTEIDRVIVPDDRELSGHLVEPVHTVNLVRNVDKYVRLKNSKKGDIVANIDKKKRRKTRDWECSCGETGESEKQAHDHLDNIDKHANASEIYEQLEDVAVHGFEFDGMEGHNTSIVWKHQELGIKVYVTPQSRLTGDTGQTGRLVFQVDGTSTEFEELNNHEQFRERYTDGLEFKEYVKLVRDFIEKRMMDENQRKQTRGADR